MPTGDNSQKDVNTVQTMLATKKTGNTSKQNPPKRDKELIQMWQKTVWKELI